MGEVLVKKIAIVGAESTGKTWLAEHLAQHFNCTWVPEYSRQYLTELEGDYTAADVEAIARGQLKLEDEIAAQATGPWLFCDTNLVVIKVWMDVAYGDTPDWIVQEILNRPYQGYILTDYDIPYEPDPLREHPEMRDMLTAMYEATLEGFDLPFVKVSGSKQARLQQCIELLKP